MDGCIKSELVPASPQSIDWTLQVTPDPALILILLPNKNKPYKMKKTMSVLALGFMSFVAFSNQAQAQNFAGPVAFLETKTFHSSVLHVSGLAKRDVRIQ